MIIAFLLFKDSVHNLGIVPLMAAGGPSPFSLDEKGPKNQANPIASAAQGQTPGPVDWQAFTRFFDLSHNKHNAQFEHKPSAVWLRMNQAKQWWPSAAAGLSGMLPEA